MTNFDLMLSKFADDNKCTRRLVEMSIGSYIYDITEVTEGSEKQIKWAVDIQRGAIKVIASLYIRAEEAGTIEEAKPVLDNIVKNIFTHTSAKWYIDNRDNLDHSQMILKNFAK